MKTKTDHTYLLKLARDAINGTRCAPPYVLEWEGSIPGNPECYAEIAEHRFAMAPIIHEDIAGRYVLTIDAMSGGGAGRTRILTQRYWNPTCAFIEAEEIARALTRKGK